MPDDSWNTLLDSVIDHLDFRRELGEKSVALAPDAYRDLVNARHPRPVVAETRAAEVHAGASTPPETAEERRAECDALNTRIAACQRCSLAAQCARKVCGSGNPFNPDLFFIGGMPSEADEASGKIFSDAAGELFDKMIAPIGYTRENIYLTNAVKCRLASGKSPSHQDVAACAMHLRAEIDLVKPRVIVLLGPLAVRGLFSELRNVCDTIGQWHLYANRTKAMAIHHPLRILSMPGATAQPLKRAAWEALKRIRAEIDSPSTVNRNS